MIPAVVFVTTPNVAIGLITARSATGTTELTATVMKDGLVRADTLPLVLQVMGADGLPRGAHVRVRLGAMDLISLDVGGTVIERLDQPVEDLAEDEGDDELAAPLAIAVDMDAGASTPAPTADTDNPAS